MIRRRRQPSYGSARGARPDCCARRPRVVALRYQAEQHEGARVRALFSRYVAPPVVEELLRRKDPRLYTGRSLYATIVVCRIWNFAGFAETLTAEQTLRYLNEFLDRQR